MRRTFTKHRKFINKTNSLITLLVSTSAYIFLHMLMWKTFFHNLPRSIFFTSPTFVKLTILYLVHYICVPHTLFCSLVSLGKNKELENSEKFFFPFILGNSLVFVAVENSLQSSFSFHKIVLHGSDFSFLG